MDLWVIIEPTHPLQVFTKHKTLMTQEGITKSLGPIHKELVLEGTAYFLSIQERSLVASKMVWMVSSNNLKDRKPFNYGNFKANARRLIPYNNFILRGGPYWVGCHYRSPIIWYPHEGYHPEYELPEGQEAAVLAHLAQNHGFRPLTNRPYPAYSLTSLH